jgi:hypothetical protein
MNLFERIVSAGSANPSLGSGAGFVMERKAIANTTTKISLTTKGGPRKRIEQEDLEMFVCLSSNSQDCNGQRIFG